ncbi:MAG: glycosyltransferase [Acidimicrobiales bacterium]
MCFGGVDWWYHNAGHSDVRIVRHLAREHKVLWVNSIGMRAPRPGRTDLVVTRYLRKLRSTLRAVRRDPSGVTVLSPLFVPRYSEAAIARNGRLLSRQVALALKVMRVRHPACRIPGPTAGDAALGRGYRRVVFNRSDVFSAFPDVDGEVIGRVERRLLRDSDEVLFVNRGLMAAEASSTRAHRLIGHGVDLEHFASARPVDGPPPDPPPELAGLARPLIGFYGALDDYTVDLDLLVAVARRLPGASVVVIGPRQMDIGVLEREPNIHYLGPVPYDDLPRFAAQFDVGLMPWLRNEWIDRCNPVKLKEYLALGFPIVSTPFPELADHSDDVQVVEPVDFAATVARVVGCGAVDPDEVRRRREALESSSWAAVSASVADALGIA